MLSWFSKKPDGAEAPQPTPSAAAAAPDKAQQAKEAEAEWAPRLQAALGDDAALLLIATSAPALQTKLDAVEALATEEALKQAERELRTQDSRVHRAAKRRHVAAVAQREARARALELIDVATALATENPLPANRLVTLDRDWQALDAALLDAAQLSQFAELRERLNTLLREQGEQELRERQARQAEQERLLAEARQAEEARVEEAARLAALAAAEAAVAQPAPEAVPEPVAAAPAPQRLSPEQKQQLDGLLTQAETALAEGQLGEMQLQLQAVDAAFEALHGIAVTDKLRARLQALHAERGRLKAWAQWGGALALEALADEAEALGKLTLAAADPEAKAPKLRVKAHAEAIQSLRARWKEIDRVGAPSNQTLWHRFDAALQTAYQPVAAQQELLKAQRQENLQAREALLATLDAVPGDEPPTGADELTAHWKERLRALNHFQLAWRQLGPLEHTVPAASRKALQQRLRASLDRIEAPIEAARRGAEAERERLIARAEALVQELARNPATRDLVPRVRELQAEWQQHARTLPLARAVEGALWARFKGATDAVFAQREAVFNARDAELATNLAAREALLERMSGVDLAAPVAELQRALSEADREWRAPVEVPRAAVNALDKRFHAARAAIAQAVAESANKRWQTQCDTLAAKLALCEEREAAPDSDLAERWAALGELPAAWEKPLSQRWSQAAVPAGTPSCDELLLQLEAALDLPATAEQQAARRDLKLRALKEALEGRAPAAQNPAAQREQWFAALLRQSGLSAVQRERLAALITALRQAPR